MIEGEIAAVHMGTLAMVSALAQGLHRLHGSSTD
ncbi:hypothetical protein HNQ52_002895 [Chiayiivirga flava]|uniref:Uncharacterized protein n=1 Tax=Chiayiivirga flava TaxID=659595 RepID=A0A7W8G0C3_9GAMM|nr:hypothetical protein [Chiayiivirga flava]